jgi:hypothetical protein
MTTYFIRFLFRDQSEDLVCQVQKRESERLELILNDFNKDLFFCFDVFEGKTVAVNLEEVQCVRYLWEPMGYAPDIVRSDDLVQVKLRGRSEILETGVGDYEHLAEFFSDLQFGPDSVSHPSFQDEDGEWIQFNAKEIVWVTAPVHIISEGYAIIEAKDGLTDAP